MTTIFDENLCIYDPKSPYYVEQEDKIIPRDGCACDKCFYGKDKIAVLGNELLATLKTAQWMLERDYIDPQKMAVIDKCRAAIEKAEVK